MNISRWLDKWHPDTTGRDCYHCGKPLNTTNYRKVYCDERCSKNARRQRSTRKKWTTNTLICCVCGKEAPRKKSNSLTCGSKECVKQHKKNCKAICSKEYRISGRYKDKDNYKKDKCECGKEKYKKVKYCSDCRSISRLLNEFKKMCEYVEYDCVCEVCGKEFSSENKKKICSKSCRCKKANNSPSGRAKYRRALKKRTQKSIDNSPTKQCEVCGDDFLTFNYTDRRTCGKDECREIIMMQSKCNGAVKRWKARDVSTTKEFRRWLKNMRQMKTYRCFWCGETYTPTEMKMNIDHMNSIAKGGTDTWDNICVSCRDCNATKLAKDLTVWIQELADRYEHI